MRMDSVWVCITICSAWVICKKNEIFFWGHFFFFNIWNFILFISQAGGRIRAAAESYAIVTVTWDPSRIWDLYHSSQQYLILTTLSEVRNQTCILKDISRFLNPLSHKGNSLRSYFWSLGGAYLDLRRGCKLIELLSFLALRILIFN